MYNWLRVVEIFRYLNAELLACAFGAYSSQKCQKAQNKLVFYDMCIGGIAGAFDSLMTRNFKNSSE